MTIEERIAALSAYGLECHVRGDIVECEGAMVREQLWLRVLALCKAAERLSHAMDQPSSHECSPAVVNACETLDEAIAALKKHGDIPADGMTREGPI